MLSGAELNQLLTAKSGAVFCTAATVKAAVPSCATSPLMPGLAAPTRQRAMAEAVAASDRIVMGSSIEGGGSEADLAVRVKSCQPRHDQRVVLEVGGDRERDHDNAKPLLQ